MKKIVNKYSLVVVLILVIIITGSIGYSLLSQNLQISGSAKIKRQENVLVTVISDPILKDFAIVKNAPTYQGTTITFDEIELPQLTSKVSYEVTLKNISNVDQQLESINNEVYNNEDIIYTIDNLKVTDQILGGESLTFTINFHYKELETLPVNNKLGVVINFEFKEAGSKPLAYATEGLQLFLSGTDAPVNNEWVDKSGVGNARLIDVTYRDDMLGYFFNGSSSCAFTNRTIFPTTGDFTAEVYITTGSDISGDRSIIAQKNLSSDRELGRFKPFNIFSNTFRFFSNISSVNGTFNLSYSATTIDTLYHMQAVRSNGIITLYLNGQKINEQAFASDNYLSSGTTQIGCYDSATSQSFDGIIHTARIYNRALTSEELITNYALDFDQYNKVEISPLRETLISTMLTTNGDGLYYLADENRYIFRGSNPNNYIRLDGSLWRIISLESDGTMKIVKAENNDNNIAFDLPGNRNLSSTYCTMSETLIEGEFYGCNALTTSDNFTNDTTAGTVNNDSTLINFLNNDVYNGFSQSLKDLIVTHNFNIGSVALGSNLTSVVAQEKTYTWYGKVGTVTTSDVYYGWSNNFPNIETSNSNNYLLRLVDNNSIFWTMNASKKNTYDVWTMARGNTISPRRASRSEQKADNIYNLMRVAPAVYIDSNIGVLGIGSIQLPFEIKIIG